MIESDLTVISVVENDRGLVDLMIQSLYKFTTPPPKIILCSNGKNPILDKYNKDTNIKIVRNNPKMGGGSNRHGEGLNVAFALVTTPRTAIVESDCVVVRDNWHEINKPFRALMAKKCVHNDISYYYVAFMVFDTELLRGMDFRPGNDKTRGNRSYKPHEDVAWRISGKVNGDKVEELGCVDCKSGKGKCLDKSFQCEEFWKDPGPIVVHFGRGSNMAGKANRKGFSSNKVQFDSFVEKIKAILGQA